MYYRTKKDWQLKESQATPKEIYQSRREILAQMGMGTALLLSLPLQAQAAKLKQAAGPDRDRITDKDLVTRYNNFYEFSLKKEKVHQLVEPFQIHPWEIKIGGLVKKPFTLDLDDLLKKVSLEQRIYRFRCVEAWSMVVPWDGFPLNDLVRLAQPLSGARYLEFKSFYRPKEAVGQKDAGYYPWPYSEGLTIAEATNELAFISTGIYGSALPKQNGAPLRLVLPWKYGFKSIKSIVEINFVKERPSTLWNELAPREYGFFANVNPEVDHPRWSQATEKPLGSWFERIPTIKFNGYEKQVGPLYKGWDLKKLY